MDLRSYAEAYTAYKEGQQIQDVTKRPKGPSIERVQDVVWELEKERLAEAKKKP